MTCKLCGGRLHFLGALGDLKHYLCRQCGMHWNFRTKSKPSSPFDDKRR